MLWLSIIPQQTQANGSVLLEVQTGMEGEYKPGYWTPVEVIVKNNSGKDIDGYLSIQLEDDYTAPVEVAAGATKKVDMVIPSQHIYANSEVILFEGKKELASQKVDGKGLAGDTFLVAVLANDKNTGNFFGSMPKNLFPRPTRLVHLDAEDIPSFALPFQGVDMLIINDYPIDQLSQEQIDALKEWTSTGGTILFSGGSQIEKASQLLQELSTIEIESITKVAALESLSASGKELVLSQPLAVSIAKHEKGEVLLQENEIPLFIAEKVGNGVVVYAAYDLAMEPLASWSGNGEWWAKLLSRVIQEHTSQWKSSQSDSYWELQRTAERIPSLTLPNPSTLAIIFGLYILVVGPIMYFVLKILNRRDWAWFVVPLCAVMLSIGIFVFGSIERTNQILTHNVNYVDLNQQGEGQLTGVSAIFVPTGGDYKLHFADGSIVSPYPDGRRHRNDYQKTKTTLTQHYSDMTFENVEFWSMRKINVRKHLPSIGKIESNLAFQDGKLKGTITNQTSYSLRDVKILSGQYIQEIPQLEVGETVEVEVNYNTNPTIFSHGGGYPTHLLFPQVPGQPSIETRESMMVGVLNQQYYNSRNAMGLNRQAFMVPVTLIGWTEEPMIDFTVEGQNPKADHITLIKTDLEVRPSTDGTVFFPAGTFYANQSSSTAEMMYQEDGYEVGRGDVDFDFHINNQPYKIEVEKIQLYSWSNVGKQFEKKVYNWEKEEFEPYESVFENNKLTGDKLKTYLSEDGILRIQFIQNEDGLFHLGHPAISVEGKVTEQ